jgi:hypothetical protein
VEQQGDSGEGHPPKIKDLKVPFAEISILERLPVSIDSIQAVFGAPGADEACGFDVFESYRTNISQTDFLQSNGCGRSTERTLIFPEKLTFAILSPMLCWWHNPTKHRVSSSIWVLVSSPQFGWPVKRIGETRLVWWPA